MTNRGKTLSPIDSNWCENQFPSIFATFGKSTLIAQIEAFNDAIQGKNVMTTDKDQLFHKLTAKHKPVNSTLIGILSALHSQPNASVTVLATAFLLESLLAAALQDGETPTTFRSMIRSAGSYYDLIAELNAREGVRESFGKASSHTKIENSEKNYDISAFVEGVEIAGDVKWFSNFLQGGSYDRNYLNDQLKLVGDDVPNGVDVFVGRTPISQQDSIDIAIRVTELYEMFKNNCYSQEVEFAKVSTNGENAIVLTSEKGPVEQIRIHEGRPGFMIIDHAKDSDRENALRNLRSAATQLPGAQSNKLRGVFLGTSICEVIEDIEEAIYGLQAEEDKRLGGIFSEDASETDQKIDFVIFFGVRCEMIFSGVSVPVTHFAKGYCRPQLGEREHKIVRSIAEAVKMVTLMQNVVVGYNLAIT